eukprot:2425565-Pyramimonas_sp.AAC.1
MELSDDDHLRGSPRDASDLSERLQCELGHNEGMPHRVVASDRSMSRQERPTSRQVWRERYNAVDDDKEWEDDARLARRGRFPSRSSNRARARSSGARSSGLQR